MTTGEMLHAMPQRVGTCTPCGPRDGPVAVEGVSRGADLLGVIVVAAADG